MVADHQSGGDPRGVMRRAAGKRFLFFPLPAARGEVGLRSNPGEGARPQF
jgi:hypothetical protein